MNSNSQRGNRGRGRSRVPERGRGRGRGYRATGPDRVANQSQQTDGGNGGMSSGAPQNFMAGNQPNRMMIFTMEGGDSEAMKSAIQSAISFQAPSAPRAQLPIVPKQERPIRKAIGEGDKKGKLEKRQPKEQKANSRQHVGDPPEGFTHEDRLWCRNCRRQGHTLIRCIGPVNNYGFIRGCAWCETIDHCTEECSYYQDLLPVEQEQYLAKVMLCKRRNRPPMGCTIAPADHALGKPGQKFEHFRPWSPTQSMSWRLEHSGYWKEFEYAGPNEPWNDPVLAEIDPFEHDVFLETVSHIGVRFEAWEKIARPADKKRKREGDDSNSQGHKRPNNNTTGKSKYDTPVAVSDRDGDAKMGAVVPVKHRMEQERTFLNMEVARQCKNCGGNDHRTKECIAVCGGCGHPNHV